MSLTEVVFEVGDPQYPICQFTRDHPEARVVYRVVDVGHATGLFRATMTVIAPQELSASLVKELRATQRYDDFEIASITPYGMILKLGHRVPEAREFAGVGVGPVGRFLEAFGNDSILEPFLVEGGRIRVRCLIAQALDTKRALLRLQELQKGMTWKYFRVIRVAEFKAVKYADGLRRLLRPEQEELLRLALSLGYYDSPKKCTLEDIAKRVGLSVSPVHKKLKNVEQTLINAYLDPTSVQTPEPRRGRRYGVRKQEEAAAPFTEVNVRVTWTHFTPAAFTAKHPGTRIIFQPLHDDPNQETASALLVGIAPATMYRPLIDGYERAFSVREMEVVSKDEEHVSVKLRTSLPRDGAWRDHPNPFPHLARKFDRDAYMKPIVVEGSDVWLRLVVTRTISVEELRQRLENVGVELGWDQFEITSLRRLELDPTTAPIPLPDKMTPRQEEVLKIAHALGYYKTPRECTLEEVANTLGISANAIHKNLTAAEQKIICNYLANSI